MAIYFHCNHPGPKDRLGYCSQCRKYLDGQRERFKSQGLFLKPFVDVEALEAAREPEGTEDTRNRILDDVLL